jgi:hypothetical protein
MRQALRDTGYRHNDAARERVPPNVQNPAFD